MSVFGQIILNNLESSMKKITVLMAMVAMLGSNAAFAQTNDKYKKAPCPSASNDFAWGIGLTGLAVIGVVAGLTAGMASGSN
jgi:hypothetical protein